MKHLKFETLTELAAGLIALGAVLCALWLALASHADGDATLPDWSAPQATSLNTGGASLAPKSPSMERALALQVAANRDR